MVFSEVYVEQTIVLQVHLLMISFLYCDLSIHSCKHQKYKSKGIITSTLQGIYPRILQICVGVHIRVRLRGVAEYRELQVAWWRMLSGCVVDCTEEREGQRNGMDVLVEPIATERRLELNNNVKNLLASVTYIS